MTLAPDLGLETELRERARDALDLLLGLVEAQGLIRQARTQCQGQIPVIIVAGFLGSGKTTLLRHVLTAAHGKRIAAVVNDFAALNVDAALIADVTADTVALENGCICCSISGSVARTLLAITERAERPDVIIIEASGVADPANIAQIAATLPAIVLDSIVTVVDASAGKVAAELSGLNDRQLRSADIILLNKIDLVSRQDANALSASIRQAVPQATVLQTSNCAVPLALLLDIGSVVPSPLPVRTKQAEPVFQSVIVDGLVPFQRLRLERLLSSLPEQILRLKGFVRLTEQPDQLWLVQAVGRRWRMDPTDSAPDRLGLVAIGLSDAVFTEVVESHFCLRDASEQC